MAADDFWWAGWWGAGAGVVAVVRVAGVCGGGVRWGYDDSHGGHDDGVGWAHGHHLGHHLGHNLGTMWTSLGILRPVVMPNYSNCDPAVAKNFCSRPFVVHLSQFVANPPTTESNQMDDKWCTYPFWGSYSFSPSPKWFEVICKRIHLTDQDLEREAFQNYFHMTSR